MFMASVEKSTSVTSGRNSAASLGNAQEAWGWERQHSNTSARVADSVRLCVRPVHTRNEAKQKPKVTERVQWLADHRQNLGNFYSTRELGRNA